MNDGELLDRIHGTAWIDDLLGYFDFDMYRRDYGPVEPVALPGGEPLEMIAGDGSGGAFMLVGDGPVRPVLYVGSEGEGGLIAVGLRAALALVVGLPSLHDATTFPVGEAGGSRLRDWLAECDADIRADRPDLDETRARLRAALDLPDVDEASLRAFQEAAADLRYRPFNQEGLPYRSMLDWRDEPWHGPDRPWPVTTVPVAGEPAHHPGQEPLF